MINWMIHKALIAKVVLLLITFLVYIQSYKNICGNVEEASM